MRPILYTSGDSVVWGAELKDKSRERFSYLVSEELDMIDCNNASAGVSNDYIYRQTMRDVSHWLQERKCWSEESGWVYSNQMYVIIGWTAPTRFEWWNGKSFQQERLWTGYDKWGKNDKDRTTEDEFVLNQTSDIPSYIRTFNHIIGLSAFLDLYKIPYHFFNVFYEYDFENFQLEDRFPDSLRLDPFGRDESQICLTELWNNLPMDFTNITMYNYLKERNGEFLPRNHPSKESHKIWADYIKNEI